MECNHDFEIALGVAKLMDELDKVKGPDFDKIGKQMMLIGGSMMATSLVVAFNAPAIVEGVHNLKTKVQKRFTKKAS